MELKINPKFIFKILVINILILFIANCLGIAVRYIIGDGYDKYVKLFDFDEEDNFPTYYSSVSLLFASVLLLFISYFNKYNGIKYILWFILAMAFFYASLDEFTQLHEKLDNILRKAFNPTGIFFYAWVIPYGIVALLTGIIYYFYFLRKLPKKISRLFIFSGVTFITGAIGFELIGSKFITEPGHFNLTTSILYTFEELFEMSGITLFIYALLLYIKNNVTKSITFKKIAPEN